MVKINMQKIKGQSYLGILFFLASSILVSVFLISFLIGRSYYTTKSGNTISMYAALYLPFALMQIIFFAGYFAKLSSYLLFEISFVLFGVILGYTCESITTLTTFVLIALGHLGFFLHLFLNSKSQWTTQFFKQKLNTAYEGIHCYSRNDIAEFFGLKNNN